MRILCLLILLVSSSVYADLYIVVNEKSAIEEFEIDDIADVYLGRKKTLGSTYINQVLDRTGEDRRRFFRTVTNMRESQVNAYWAKLKFSGSMRAPEEVDSNQLLLEKIIENPMAIGYMTESPPQNSGVKVALQIDE
ncbi:hypothetical protein [Vibrio atypicus]|jgi:hypothetical protein|uniref:hypothetical protein n=1 Tax=Vibrio atypicus TaxID=558271 RepID=UPI001359F6FF|nr:hypothetical protein [Vibrio atypicus]